MDVLSSDELDQVAGGFLPLTILGVMLLNLEKLTAAVTGAVDGMRDGFSGNPDDPSANPDY